MPETTSQNYRIPADHPCLPGHFPGDPIVPGVVLLDLAGDLLKQWKPGYSISAIAQAKFHQPLRPEQAFTITLTEFNSDSIKFFCRRDEETLASGRFSIEASA